MYSPTPSQVIDGHFVDQGRLLNTLRDVFGASEAGVSQFRVEVRQLVGNPLSGMLTSNLH
jgi:hypothetical protein